jgi:hypothetical protein
MTQKRRRSTFPMTVLILSFGLLAANSGCSVPKPQPLQCLCDCPDPTGSGPPIPTPSVPANGSPCNATNCELGCIPMGCNLEVNGAICESLDGGTGQ